MDALHKGRYGKERIDAGRCKGSSKMETVNSLWQPLMGMRRKKKKIVHHKHEIKEIPIILSSKEKTKHTSIAWKTFCPLEDISVA